MLYATLIPYDFIISLITCSGGRTFSLKFWGQTSKMILDKVLSDERTMAFAMTIDHINKYFLDCKECNWFKSEQSILPEARLFTKNN